MTDNDVMHPIISPYHHPPNLDSQYKTKKSRCSSH